MKTISLKGFMPAFTLLLTFTTGTVNADDIQIVNANIITMDDDNPTASTMVISGNRIVSVGGMGMGMGGGMGQGQMTVINAKGKVVIPGIIDEHIHWIRSAITWGFALHAAENAFTLQDLEDAIKARAAEVPANEWLSLIGRHTHLQFLEDPNDPLSGRHPTRQELDQWAPNHRVLLLQRFTATPVGDGQFDFNRAIFTGPGQMNTSAIAFFNGLFGEMPSVDPIPADGVLTEALNDQVFAWTRANNTLEDQVRSVIDLARWSHSVGLVGVDDAGGGGFRQTQDYFPVMEANRRGQLNVRIRYLIRPLDAPGTSGQSRIERLANIMSAAPLAETQSCVGPAEISGEGFHMSRLGGPFFRTMGLGEFFTAPTAGAIQEAITFVLRRPDWSVHQHSESGQIGNVLTGFEVALAAFDPCRIGTFAERHNSMDHLNDATANDLIRMAAIGVGAGIQALRFVIPDWQFSGPPYRAALDTPNLVVGFGSDAMFGGNGNPWTNMQFMVTGETFNGEDILTNDPLGRGPQQITLMEGLRGYTRGSAWFTREEHERGQLKAGYLADVVILEQNPFEADVHSIRDTKAALTIVDGEVVHSNGSL